MRLVVLSPTMELAGAQRVMVTLANAFGELGHQTHLVTLGGRSELVDEVSPLVEYHQLDAPKAVRAVPDLRRLIGRLRPHGIISVLQGSYLSVMATRSLSPPPVLVAGHHNRPREVWAIERSPRAGAVLAVLAAAYRAVDVTVAVCQDSVDQLADMLAVPTDKMVVLDNPIDLEQLDRRSLDGEAHPLLHGTHPGLVLVASHTPKKRIDAAIAAMELLPDHRLVVLGDGRLRTDLQADIDRRGLGDRVELAGLWPNPFPSMVAADAVLSTSVSEALPLGLIEAVCLATKVVTTDSGSGTRQIVADYDGAVLVPEVDPQAIADGIRAIADRHVVPAQVQTKRQTYDRFTVARTYLELVERFRPS